MGEGTWWRRRIPRVASRWWIPQGANKQTLAEAVFSSLCHENVLKLEKGKYIQQSCHWVACQEQVNLH